MAGQTTVREHLRETRLLPMLIERLYVGAEARLREIRLRALKDAPDAFASTFDDAASRPPENWERQLEQLATFVATSGGCDLGLVRGAYHDHIKERGYLISMWVAPEARRRGVGSDLVDAVIEWAKGQELNRLLLDVAETNAAAIAFYTRKGFVPNGVLGQLPPPRDHIREIQMAMPL
jgi:GNAT superfamily N-acetyltransferase